MKCKRCNELLSAEDKLLSRIFSNQLCTSCVYEAEDDEEPSITVNGIPLKDYLTRSN